MAIKRVSSGEIRVTWDDDHVSQFAAEYLRLHCPCAVCAHEREENERSGFFSLPLAAQNELRNIEPSGHNAIIITWGDGHKTGIYTWEYLRRICRCERCR